MDIHPFGYFFQELFEAGLFLADHPLMNSFEYFGRFSTLSTSEFSPILFSSSSGCADSEVELSNVADFAKLLHWNGWNGEPVLLLSKICDIRAESFEASSPSVSFISSDVCSSRFELNIRECLSLELLWTGRLGFLLRNSSLIRLVSLDSLFCVSSALSPSVVQEDSEVEAGVILIFICDKSDGGLAKLSGTI